MGARLVRSDGIGAVDLESAAGGAAQALRDAGMGAGDRVLLWADNGPSYAAAVAAAAELRPDRLLLIAAGDDERLRAALPVDAFALSEQ